MKSYSKEYLQKYVKNRSEISSALRMTAKYEDSLHPISFPASLIFPPPLLGAGRWETLGTRLLFHRDVRGLAFLVDDRARMDLGNLP